MSQLGYIMAAIALMSHLGWVTALYLVRQSCDGERISVSCRRSNHSTHRPGALPDLVDWQRRCRSPLPLRPLRIVAMSGLPRRSPASAKVAAAERDD
jgi:hypothetical protein